MGRAAPVADFAEPSYQRYNNLGPSKWDKLWRFGLPRSWRPFEDAIGNKRAMQLLNHHGIGVQNEEGKMNASEETMKSEQVIDIRRWEDLPLDCLVNIFKRLGVEDMTTGVPFVCKSWYEAHLNPSCWKILDLRAMYKWPQSPFIGRFMHEYRLKKFTTRGFLKIIINRSHKSLTELILPDYLLPLSEMVYICKECPMANVYASWHSEQDPGFIRSFVMTFNGAVKQHLST